MVEATPFTSLDLVAGHLRAELERKPFVVLYAYNGTGKTRLSTAFKELGRGVTDDDATSSRDTLYFNAYTEDLFSWDNDLENDSERKLKLNTDSRFFAGLESMEMDNRIRKLLSRYADFDFRIDTTTWEVSFARELRVRNPEDGSSDAGEYETRREESIKVSRGEENLFIWCFFLAIVELALDDDNTGPYNWVKYVYVDDPISSLDENNAVAVAHHLVDLLARPKSTLKVVVSTHHALFFNVVCNHLRKKSCKYLLTKTANSDGYALKATDSTPFLQHLASLTELDEVQRSGDIFTHHFNSLRRVMEQTASFFGLKSWSDCIKIDDDDPDTVLMKRVIDLMSHGDYSLYEPREMMEENKRYFRITFAGFINAHPFSPSLFLRETPTSEVA